MRQGNGEHRRPRPAAATDDGHDLAANPVVARRFGRFGEPTNQFTLLVGQPKHVLGPDRDRGRPGCRRGFGTGHHGDVRAAWQRVPPAPIRGRLINHHGRGRQPGLPAHRGPAAGVHHPNTHGRCDPVQLVAQFRFGQHRQDARARRAGFGRRCRRGHPSTVRGPKYETPVPKWDLWMGARLCTNRSGCTQTTHPRNAREQRRAGWRRDFLPQKRDDPRQGGRRRGSSCISPGGSG